MIARSRDGVGNAYARLIRERVISGISRRPRRRPEYTLVPSVTCVAYGTIVVSFESGGSYRSSCELFSPVCDGDVENAASTTATYVYG